jgi:hypothetical protein
MFTNRLFYLLIVVLLIVTACTPASTQTALPTLVSSTSTLGQSTELIVTSTLDGLATLPHRIAWVANPNVPENQISEVDFLIDDQVAFVEKHAPYTYGRDGNYLVTSFLTPGQHNFKVRVITVASQSVESMVNAAVEAAPNPPNELANTSWTREITSEDVKKATSLEPPPSGQWGLAINSVGWIIDDPLGGGLDIDLAYQVEGQVELRPTIEEPTFPNGRTGAFCHEPDPSFLWTYKVSNDGKTLTLHPVGQDPCGDRAAILEGAWTRAGN